MAGSETSTGLEEPLRLCDFIRSHRARVLEAWAVEACRLPGLPGLSRPQLLDHLPELLDRIANVVETVHTGEHRTLEEFPEVHALDRLDAGFDLEQVASEYALLRTCILRLYSEYVGERNTGVLVREMLRFNQTFDTAVITAVARYARTRDWSEAASTMPSSGRAPRPICTWPGSTSSWTRRRWGSPSGTRSCAMCASTSAWRR